MLVTTKGYDITTSFTKVLDGRTDRRVMEFINKTAGVVSLYVGTSPTDKDSIPIAVGNGYFPPVPLGNDIYMKSTEAGVVVILTNQEEA